MSQRKPIYKIFHDGYDWVAVTSEFKHLSGCAKTPKEALRELFCAIASARKALKNEEATP